LSKKRLFVLLVLVVFAVAACSRADDPPIVIKDVWARPGSAQRPPAVSAIYMTIENNTSSDDRLLRIETDVTAISEIHQTTIADDIARMRPLEDGLELPANETVILEPGGTHIMLMQLQRDLEVGDTFAIALQFASGATMTVDVPVREQNS